MDRPNQNANKEPAEGSRETVRDQDRQSGITNRPIAREKEEQSQLPPRGESKGESKKEEHRHE